MKICLAYPYATWLMGLPCGGAEKQVGLLAQQFARRGHSVTFLALDHDGADEEMTGVHVRPAREDARRASWPRVGVSAPPRLKRLVEEAGADLYYVRGAQAASRWILNGAHAQGTPALLGLASDRNLLPESGRMIAPFGHSPVGRVTGRLAWLLLQRPALRTADAVVAQNGEQAARCSRMGLPNVLIPSIVPPPDEDLLGLEVEYDAVWAGNVHTSARAGKGFEALRRVAEALPGVRFAVAGRLTHASLAGDLASLRSMANVDMLGPLSNAEMQEVIARSRVVLNTSPAEGFSNVMLEGWALGRPALTLAVNPSRLLAFGRWPSADLPTHAHKDSLGVCALGDIGLLIRLVDEAAADRVALGDIGQRCRAYVTKTHNADVVCARYEDLAALPFAAGGRDDANGGPMKRPRHDLHLEAGKSRRLGPIPPRMGYPRSSLEEDARGG